MGKKKNKKKDSTPTTPQSSTTQSSTPSVEDETQQLLRGGASGSSAARSSRSTEKTKGSDKKSSSGKPRNLGTPSSRNAPESGYLPESLLDVPDEERGAVGPESPSKCNCENKQVHQPECPELKKLDARSKSPNDKALKNPTGSKSSSSHVSSLPEDGGQSSSSSDPSVGEHLRNAPQSECPGKNLLAVPEQRSQPVSPSKRSPIREGFNKFCKKFSPKRSSGTECNCENKKVHQPDCLHLKKLEADDKDKSLRKSPSKSKHPSGNVSSKKTKDAAQSSSSSDPSVKEYLRSDPPSERSAEKSLLTVPEQGSGPVSPSKKSPIREGYEKLRKKFSPNRSSGTEDRANPEVELQEQKRQTGAKNKSRKGKLQKNKSKSGTSSSSASPITTKKNKDSDTSNVSSDNFRCSNSKSSSASDRNVAEYSSPSRSSKTLGYPAHKRSNKSEDSTSSSNPADYDPQEGTSRGPARRSPQKRKSKGSGGCKSEEKPLSGEDKFLGVWRKIVKDMGEEVSEDMVPIIKHMEEDSEEDEQARSRHIPRRRSKSFISCRLRIFVPGTKRPSSPVRFDRNTKLNIKSRRIHWPWLDEIKRMAKKKAEERAKKRDKAAAEKEDPAVIIKRNSADEFEQTRLKSVPTVRYNPAVRFASASPVRLRTCMCESRYLHSVGCSRCIDARRRRKRRRCRQDI